MFSSITTDELVNTIIISVAITKSFITKYFTLNTFLTKVLVLNTLKDSVFSAYEFYKSI